MKKAVVAFVLGGVLGVGAGAGAMLIAFPFLFPPPEANEQVAAAAELVNKARLREDAPGQDGAHWGRGGVAFFRDVDGALLLVLQKDFEVGPGPNFWIYLNAAADIDDEDDFKKDAARVRLAKLKSFKGAQVYRVEDEQAAQAQAVTIWCESFHQYIASANIRADGGDA